jgi:hypothetical protein
VVTCAAAAGHRSNAHITSIAASRTLHAPSRRNAYVSVSL